VVVLQRDAYFVEVNVTADNYVEPALSQWASKMLTPSEL